MTPFLQFFLFHLLLNGQWDCPPNTECVYFPVIIPSSTLWQVPTKGWKTSTPPIFIAILCGAGCGTRASAGWRWSLWFLRSGLMMIRWPLWELGAPMTRPNQPERVGLTSSQAQTTLAAQCLVVLIQFAHPEAAQDNLSQCWHSPSVDLCRYLCFFVEIFCVENLSLFSLLLSRLISLGFVCVFYGLWFWTVSNSWAFVTECARRNEWED